MSFKDMFSYLNKETEKLVKKKTPATKRKEHYQKNKEEIKSINKSYYERNKEKIRARQRDYYYRPEVKEYNRKYQKEYRAKNETKEYQREYYQRNKEEIKAQRREYEEGKKLDKKYLKLLDDVLTNGTFKQDRTKTGTYSVFGRQIRHNLNNGFPMLTTKKISFHNIACELLWFLKGDTNINWLNKQNPPVNIWNNWSNEHGDLGAIYGKQWTDWNGINQIEYVVEQLKKNPNSRRILFHAWNVEFLPDENISPQENVKKGKMALPPCHLIYQFYVVNNKLSALLYIRSSDIFLGLPYNIASVSLLTHMLAQQCDLIPHEIVVSIGDLHLYQNHLEQAKIQLSRKIVRSPKLHIINKPKSIFDYKLDDFRVVNYFPKSSIKADISV